MASQYSIAEARNNLPSLVRNAEQGKNIELTRRGKPVAVLMSLSDFQRLRKTQAGFWDALHRLEEENGTVTGSIGEGEFENIRDLSIGREVHL